MTDINHDNLDSAVFAGGCFWCVEADFGKRPDIKDVESGYTGGTTDNPSYETAADNRHREAVRVWYDPDEIDYKNLVAHFFATHDPTDPGGSFADRGYTYTSAIYYGNEHQKEVAETIMKALQEAGVYGNEIVTDLKPLDTFWRAENYHQEYAEKNPKRYKRYRQASDRAEFIADHKQEVYEALGI